MQAHVIDVRDEEGMKLLSDGTALASWELLRRFGGTMGAAAISRSLRANVEEIQRALVLLIDHGIVQVHPARGRRRVPAYSCRKVGVTVEYRPHDPVDERAMQAAIPRIATAGQAAAVRVQSVAAEDSAEPKAMHRNLRISTHLDAHDAEELRSRIDDLVAFMRLLESKYVGEDALDAVHCNYTVDVAVRPIPAPLAATPMVVFRPVGLPAKVEAGVASKDAGILSPREREVAVGIVNGRSRSDIADRLGITASTVATLTKRLYRKLGVHSKSQLSHRLVGQRASV